MKPPRSTSVSTVADLPVSRPRSLLIAWLAACLGILLARGVYAEHYALLIGIDQYLNQSPRVPRLNGTVNDVKNMRQMLIREYGFQPEHIVMLTDGQATLAAVRREFQRAADRLGPDDTFVFHFAGHGTQLQDDDGDEQLDDPDDVLDEALCMYDFTERGENALRDDELGRLLNRLAAGQVVVILDCCHSGTATRDITTVGSARYWPLALPVGAPLARHTPPGIRGSVAPDLQRARPGQRRVVFSACSAIQKAHELDHRYAEFEFSTGLFTHYLVQGLRGAADTDGDGQVTYGEAHQYALRRIDETQNRAQETERLRQTPTLETEATGTRDLPVFGIATKQPMHANASGAGPETVQLDLGAVHGLMPDTRWALFRDLNDVHAKNPPLGEIRVTSVGAETSRAAVLDALADGNRWIAAPLVNPLTSPAAFLWTERMAVDGKVPNDLANRLLQDLNSRLAERPQVRIDARGHWDLHVIFEQRTLTANAIEIVVRCVERNGREHPPKTFRAPLPFLPPDRSRRCDEILSWLEPQIAAVRARQTLAGLTNPSPGFGLQAVVDRRPSEGQTLAEYQQGDPLVFGLKSTADCWYYIVAIDPQGKPQVWCPQPDQHHQAPADVKLLHPGPGETLILDGPPGVYTVKLLAVRNSLPADAFRAGLPRPEVFRALPPDQWSESAVSFRLLFTAQP